MYIAHLGLSLEHGMAWGLVRLGWSLPILAVDMRNMALALYDMRQPVSGYQLTTTIFRIGNDMI